VDDRHPYLLAFLLLLTICGLMVLFGTNHMHKLGLVLARVIAWVWACIAGVGGLALVIHQGPLPVTNGWFAMFSGIEACPLTASLLKKYAGIFDSGWVQFGLALLIFIAGRVAVVLVLHRPFLPQ
jgi:hypothetical protein